MNPTISWNPAVDEHANLSFDSESRMFIPGLPPAQAAWIKNNGTIMVLRFTCPCGCGYIGSTPVNELYGERRWKWNGDTEKPTLEPSIQMLSACRWHGYLRNGVFEKC